mgnify:CR=1 FL=1
MKISVFYDYKIFFNQNFGGPSRYFLSLINSLDKNQIDFLISSPIYHNQYLKEFCKQYEKNISGIYIKNKVRYSHKILSFYNYIFSSLKFKFSKSNIYHPTYYGKGIIDFGKKPVILTVYDLIHEKYYGNLNLRIIDKKKYLINKASHFICISNNTKKDLIKYYNVDEKKISVIYPGVKNIFLDFETNYEFKLKLEKPYFLYVGTRNKYKNYKNFLKAYSISEVLKKNFNIVFFGGGQFTKNEKIFFNDLNIDLNNLIYDNGSDYKLKEYYLGATALVYPSFYEGFGLVPLEAMNYGCPVLSSNTSCLPEVQENASEKFDPKSIDSIKTSLEKVVYDKNLKKYLIQEGYKRVKNFSWDKCAKETEKIYKSFS